jgi:hypothetical protein
MRFGMAKMGRLRWWEGKRGSQERIGWIEFNLGPPLLLTGPCFREISVSGIGKCKLCNENRKLCESHVIPEFMYQPVYKDHKAIGIVGSPERLKVKTIQKGLREPLLCNVCEAHLNDSFERPNSLLWKALRDRTPPPPPAEWLSPGPEPDLIAIANLPYSSLKLLFLSILWRASVAKRPDFYETDLGPYEEVFRQYLLQQTATDDLMSPICFMTSTFPAIAAPKRLKYGHNSVYSLILAGMEIWIFIGEISQYNPLMPIRLKGDGSLRILRQRPGDSKVTDELLGTVRKLKKEQQRTSRP